MPLRVAFVGQSITIQAWAYFLEQRLRQDHPNVLWEFRNWGLAGFGPGLLLPTLDATFVEQQPDLVILHAYLEQRDYARLVRRIRERTTADILIQTDHPIWESHLAELPPTPETGPDDLLRWYNRVFLPTTARRAGATLADVRTSWIDYLNRNRLAVTNIIEDGVHLNIPGNQLLTDTLIRYFQPDPKRKDYPDPFQMPGISTFTVGREIQWKNGLLDLELFGSRVEIITSGYNPAEYSVTIDGQPPSRLPGQVQFGRPAPFDRFGWLAIVKVRNTTPLIPENWTLTLTDVTPNTNTPVRFRVAGSVTGFDGEGDNTQRFVSRSGRVVFEPKDLRLRWAEHAAGAPLVPGMVFRWNAIQQGQDKGYSWYWEGGTIGATQVANGLHDAIHQLQIRAAPSLQKNIRAIRAYSPSRRAQAASAQAPPPPRLAISRAPTGWCLQWPAEFPDYRLETRPVLEPLNPWQLLPDGANPVGIYNCHAILSYKSQEWYRLVEWPTSDLE